MVFFTKNNKKKIKKYTNWYFHKNTVKLHYRDYMIMPVILALRKL